MLKGKHIVLGITGSIAAYKSAVLARLLIKKGAEVQIVITPSGKEFITPITLSAITSKPVISEFFSGRDGSWNSHVDIGLWADAMLIAPATASTIGKMASGVADNMLITTYLSMKAPVFVAPAMDLDMFAHPSTTDNIELLKRRGNIIIEPREGVLASHLVGKGRMEEPEDIVSFLENYFSHQMDMCGKKAMVTAGPTHEYIDPVRYIGNSSSGLMGISIANELSRRGAEVTLVLGPSNIKPESSVKVVNVVSALEMYEKSKEVVSDCDIAVFSAAVADYRPEDKKGEKMKRNGVDNCEIRLVRNPDIAASLGREKTDKQFFVGFSLETDNGFDEAKRKLKSKNLDAIVLNTLKDEGAGFGVDTNKITIITDSVTRPFTLKSKKEVAKDIVDFIKEMN